MREAARNDAGTAQVAGTPAEPETVRRINYWDAVLAWVKAQEGTDVIVMNRAG